MSALLGGGIEMHRCTGNRSQTACHTEAFQQYWTMSVAADIEAQVQSLRNLRRTDQGNGTLIRAVEAVSNSLVIAYKAAAQRAKNAVSPDEEEAVWQEMSDACTSALVEMKQFKDELRVNGTAELYDQALDLKLASEERKNWVLEEKACRIKIPKGLFPEKS
jgi:hypothetical protein